MTSRTNRSQVGPVACSWYSARATRVSLSSRRCSRSFAPAAVSSSVPLATEMSAGSASHWSPGTGIPGSLLASSTAGRMIFMAWARVTQPRDATASWLSPGMASLATTVRTVAFIAASPAVSDSSRTHRRPSHVSHPPSAGVHAKSQPRSATIRSARPMSVRAGAAVNSCSHMASNTPDRT